MAAASFPSSLLKYGELLGTRLDWLMVCSKNLQRTHNDNKIEQFLTVIMTIMYNAHEMDVPISR